MAYQLKYYFGFKPAGKNENHVVQLWQNTDDVLVAEEVTGGVPPFTVEFPEITHKFQPVRGSGCNINLFSDTDMKFFVGLEHIDPQEFMIIHLIDGVKNWLGFLNSDMYTEPYDQSENYIINTTGTDGFSLMDRLRFIQSDGTDYVGIKSLWEIIEIILTKINLPYIDIRVSLSTSFAEMVTNILTDCYVDCANFYNEDGLAMTLREVMEGILNPFGAFICQIKASIYITDIHTLAGGDSITYQKFSASTFEYVSDVTETNNLKNISDIGYKGTGQSIDRSGGVNRQVVTYSPYPNKSIVNDTIVNPDEFDSESTELTKHGYYYRTLYDHNTFYSYGGFEVSSPSPFVDLKERNVYAIIPKEDYPLILFNFNLDINKYLYIKGATFEESIKLNDYINKTYLNGVALLVQAEILVKMEDNPYTANPGDNDFVGWFRMGFRCSIGDYDFNNGTKKWQQGAFNDNIITTYSIGDSEGIANKFVKLGQNGEGILMPLVADDEAHPFGGKLSFGITAPPLGQWVLGRGSYDTNYLKETWIKNVSIRLVNIDGSEIEDLDAEYIGLLDERFAEEGEQIGLICGTASKYCDKGKLMYLDTSYGIPIYIHIDEFTRSGQTFKIEELLLNSLCSNYKKNFLTLNSVKLKNDLSLINTITDTFIYGKVMMISGAIIDYREDETTVKLTEIVEDELDIILT